MGSSIYQAVKNPNVVQTAAMEDSNILLVLLVSMTQTLVNRPQAHYLHSTSASVPTFSRDEQAMKSCSELSSYFSSYQYCCSVCAEILQLAELQGHLMQPFSIQKCFVPFIYPLS